MAHITEFTINGLVGRNAPYTKKLNRDVNVFFGINGSGKTTLLKILSSAMANDTSILRNAFFESAEVKIYSVDYDDVFTYSIVMPKDRLSSHFDNDPFSNALDQKNFERRVPNLKWQRTPDIKLNVDRWRHAYLPTSRLYIGSDSYPGREISPWELEFKFVDGVQAIWSRYYTNLLGTVREAQEKGLGSILRQVLSPKMQKLEKKEPDLDAAYTSAMNFLSRQVPAKKPVLSKIEFMERYNSDPLLRHVVDDIERVEEQIEEATLPKNKLQEIISEMFSNKSVDLSGRIAVSTEQGDEIHLAHLSSGEKHLLQIMVAVAGVAESSIFIDEPELSMHIDWQRHLIASMREVNPNVQLILATHSPEILAEINDSKIFRV